jgi:hypothetical protein
MYQHSIIHTGTLKDRLQHSLRLLLTPMESMCSCAHTAIAVRALCEITPLRMLSFIPLPPSSFASLALAHYCESAFEGGSWHLVRRVKQGRSWHPVNDNLRGTALAYGQYGGPTFDASFGIPFAEWLRNSTEMLFMTGIT